MGKKIDKETLNNIISKIEEGYTIKEISVKLKLNYKTMYTWINKGKKGNTRFYELYKTFKNKKEKIESLEQKKLFIYFKNNNFDSFNNYFSEKFCGEFYNGCSCHYCKLRDKIEKGEVKE